MGKTVTKVCTRCGKEYQADAWREKHKKYQRVACGLACAKKWHPPVEERFFNKVEKKPNGCWIWTGHCNSRGYPMFYEDGVVQAGHRWAYKHWVGAIKAGRVLRHKCDVPACVNPNHLETGTLQDNSRDALIRKRRVGQIKLDPEKVREIRKLIAGRKVDWAVYREVGKKFGVGPSTIYHMHVGRTWSWVA